MASRTQIRTEKAPTAIGSYSQAIVANGFVFASGQLGLTPGAMDFVGDDVASQTEQALLNLAAVLMAAGSSLDLAVKVTVFLTDMAQFPAVNEVYASMFGDPFPARACVEVSALPKGAKVEIEAVAVVSG